ncbi:MAG: hypothetical protein H7Y42_09510 [Chitinophagaceae bacterium]|nr:hypothetical protein [Chitinophagaceae bacterium]
MNRLALILFSLLVCTSLQAQDTLPKFSVRNIGNNRIVVGWTNTFETIKQISIQRSFDSLRNFKTILTVPDATTPQNGYVDTKAPSDAMFYRLYIMLDKGVFLFSDSRRAVWDTIRRIPGSVDNPSFNVPIIPTEPIANGHVAPNNVVKAELWTPSRFVYTFKDGYLRINLPEDPEIKYSIKFFTDTDKLLFELKEVKERSFRIDKANFYRSGWFKFELYENGELKEKNKFFLPKDF